MEKQTQMIKRHLEEHGSITPLEALQHYGCMRLSARIWDLRAQGLDIETDIVSRNGAHFAQYRLVK